ncbi:potassium transporter Kup [Aquirhabdus parva]|uniref:Probable potassium transport system protein Kup n=1 Tax=Aquirhabdus parva TaxID=2283318 RepID=A0A345PA00_9GAMM|nr:potassium transporter Kup [Aquirhabdus parva]AXI04109.1 potassium transporter Kup [Aquirhabdus parva]
MTESTIKSPHTSMMALGALGVVFGDIGTSPLYALTTCFHSDGGIPIDHANVLGILSLIFWSLMIVVSLKFAIIIMRADNKGEGGIMALLALNLHNPKFGPKMRNILIALGLFGAALFFGDGIITPAISVLSAVEGLSVGTSVFTPYILPITISVLIALFMIQRRGTAAVGRYFGPIMLLWFITIGLIGLNKVIEHPAILALVNPYWAIHFFVIHPMTAFITMGAIVLTITGAEALYADMGHFGRRPIQWAWFIVVLPCLVLNYAGEGVLVLQNPAAIENPFYLLVPKMLMYPMIVLATIATVIASQAVISGVFSMIRQAMQLGYLPRMTILHTSESEIGQIYIPVLNWLLLILIVILVAMFKSSASLASAYGIAVTITLFCDTLLVACLMYYAWNWSLPKMLLVAIPFLVPDLLFLTSNMLKITDGGWFPLSVGVIAFTIMMTWKRGRTLVLEKLKAGSPPLDIFIQSVSKHAFKVSGTAVFLTTNQNIVPNALMHNLKHNKVLHEKNILLTVVAEDVPYVDVESRVRVEQIDDHFYRLVACYGFKESLNVPHALEQGLALLRLPCDFMQISFFISRERILHTVGSGMAPWREKLFISMTRNTSAISDYFQIPPNRVVEIGSQIEI